MRELTHDVLFEPMRIGPKLARNRFYQVPHCNGMGHRHPRALAAMRGMKAEGGWAVVSTEEVEIHPSSEVSPAIEGRIWDDADLPAHARVVEAIHAHGALAAIELVWNGPRANLVSRLPPMGASAGPVDGHDPIQGRAMDLDDIRSLRRWHRNAALRARRVGYDLIYVYAGHGLSIGQQFLSRRTNERTDAYGGSLENRMRLLRELIEDTKDAVGADCAVPLRIAVDEMEGPSGLERAEIEDVVAALANHPDLFDFCMGNWPQDSRSARFSTEGFQEEFVRGLKQLTPKPVVGVGRFTSPEAMVTQIRTGVLDFIGAARPSIADPFLPRKIEEGRSEDLRECIGCNICVSGDMQSVPIRCTQNPTMGEEWRRGWHPERIAPATSRKRLLIIGSGPAGLEAAHQLGKSGHEVMLAEAQDELGGRALRESRIAGLSTVKRVADYRLTQISKLSQVELFPASRMSATEALETRAQHIVIATGARWRRDGKGRRHPKGLTFHTGLNVLTPDAIMDGPLPRGPVVIYDDDHYQIGGAVAEHLARAGVTVTLATPASEVSSWTVNTLEQGFIARRLVDLGVELLTRHELIPDGPVLMVRDWLTGKTLELEAKTLVLVTSRKSEDDLYNDLLAARDDFADLGLSGVTLIGDALTPGLVAHAVHAGHLFARTFDTSQYPDAVPFLREVAG